MSEIKAQDRKSSSLSDRGDFVKRRKITAECCEAWGNSGKRFDRISVFAEVEENMDRLAGTASNHSFQPSPPRRNRFLREMRRYSSSRPFQPETAKHKSGESIDRVDE